MQMSVIMWLIALIAVLLTGALIYLRYVRDNDRYKDIAKIPGPPIKFLYGNALEIGTNPSDIFYNTQRIIKSYGSLVRIWLGPFRLHLFITDPTHVEYFLSSNDHIKKSSSYDMQVPWLGQSLLNSSGNVWRKIRKIMTPAFHFQMLEQFSDSFDKYGKVLVDKLKNEVDKPIEVQSFVTRYSMDVICSSSMKIDAKVQEKGDYSYIEACESLTEILLVRFFSVLQRFDFIFRFSSNYRKQTKWIKIVKKYTEQVVHSRKQERQLTNSDIPKDNAGIKKKQAFIDILLDSNEFTDEQVSEHVNTFLFTGHETVSAAISFGIYELAKHKKVQQLIYEEIMEVVGTDKNTPITMKHLNEMNFLDRVMKELLRLHTPVPFFERQLEEDVILDGIRIPKDTTLSFMIYAQHHNGELFPNPEKFDPDRFLPENVAKRNPFDYIPFSAGPRNCIGIRYAMLNCKTTIANFIRNFEIYSVTPIHEPILASGAVLKSLNGLPVNLKVR